MDQNHTKFSKEDFKKILEKYYNNGALPEILDFSLSPISEEVRGFMGEHMYLNVQISNGTQNTLRFFAKLVITKHKKFAKFVEDSNVFYKEENYYKFLEDAKKECPALNLTFAPKYYFSRENEILVLEDITQSGFKPIEGPRELNLEHIKLSLKALARLHTISLVYEEKISAKLGRRYQLTEDHTEQLTESLFIKQNDFGGYQYFKTSINALYVLRDLLPEDLCSLPSAEFKTKLETLFYQVFEDLKPSKRFRNVWCHGDLWTNNLMFRYDNGNPVECKILDLQHQRYNPPAHDMLFVIYFATDKSSLKKYFDYAVNYYYEALKFELEKCGYDIENILNRQEFEDSIKWAFPSVKLIKAMYYSFSAIGQENLQKLTSNESLYDQFFFFDRAERASEIFKTYEPYRNTMTELLENLDELLAEKNVLVENGTKCLTSG